MAERVLTLWENGFDVEQIAERLLISIYDVRYYLGLFR